MNKIDNRIYNRKTQRDLSIEMKLWIIFHGKIINVKKATYDDKEIYGKIIDVKYEVHRSFNNVVLFIDNNTEYRIPVKNGKPVMNSNILITNQL